VAIGTVGAGPRVVVPPAWVTSLEVIASGRDPRSSLLERLARGAELTLYDRAGTGLTGGDVDDFSLAASAAELEAVLESGDGPAALLAVSGAGPIAIAVATRRPELVNALLLVGTYADAAATFTDVEVRDSVLAMVRAHWGLGARLLAGLYRPGASDAAAYHLGRVLRDSAPADVAAGYLAASYEANVTPLLAAVRAPTLILHYRRDRVIPFAGAQQLAAGIADARLVALDGAYHLPDAADLDRTVATIEAFIAASGSSP
jgi:pimeloyl-ACP methyl ester carboxylesterase